MKATEQTIQEFAHLHTKYLEAQQRMTMLQGAALEGMRKIGIGCVTEKSHEEFNALKVEIEQILARMKEICDSLMEF
jgi:D-aminopeptidase